MHPPGVPGGRVRIGNVRFKRPLTLADTPPRLRGALNGPGYPPDGSPYDPTWGSPWAYDAQAWSSQDMGEWFPYIRHPDAEINVDRDRLVARIRDLVRNDGWAQGAIGGIADAAVGASFFPRPLPNWRVLIREDKRFDAAWAAEFTATVKAEWKLWADDSGCWCDGARSLTMTQLLHLAFVHKIRDGDALAVLMFDPARVGRGAAHYATCLQLLDPDRLSNPYQMLDQDFMRGGVQIDGLGAPVGYHIRRAEPNDWFEAFKSMIWDFFPRATDWGRPIIVHDFDRERSGQHRGVGLLTAVLARFKMLNRYDQVGLQKAVAESLLGLFVKSPYDSDMVQSALESDGEQLGQYQGLRMAFAEQHPPMLMGGLRIPKLFPGESIETVAPGQRASDFEQFEHTVLRSIAAATGQTAEEVTRDYSRTNYSSARAAMLAAWKTLIRRRTDFATGFAAPIYAGWLEEACEEGRVPLPKGAPDFPTWRSAYARSRWIGPGRGWVDPVKERQGEVLGLDAGFGTLDEVCADISGADWEERLEQRAVEVAEMNRLGLKLPNWAADQLPAHQVAAKPLAD